VPAPPYAPIVTERTTAVLVEGLRFPEGPRWHEGRLWCSDQHDRRVLAISPDGTVESIVEVPQCPSGLGWLPDGRLLVVSMHDRKLLRLDPDGLTEVADLSEHATWHCNDMVVDAAGRAYIGNFGFDIDGGPTDPVPAVIVRVDPDGSVHVAADDIRFPNGTVITPDGQTLIVAESYGACLTAFDVDRDGGLSNRRRWAKLRGAVPDGICLDAEGVDLVRVPADGTGPARARGRRGHRRGAGHTPWRVRVHARRRRPSDPVRVCR